MSTTADEYLLLWKGRQVGPFSVDLIMEKLRAGEISRIHQLGVNGGWLLLDEFLEARRETDRVAQRAAEQKAREEEMTRRYEAQLAEERAKREAATQKLEQTMATAAAAAGRAANEPRPSLSHLLPHDPPAPPTFTPTMSGPAMTSPSGGPPPIGGFGTPPPPFVDTPFVDTAPKQMSGMAVASLVLALCCFIPLVNALAFIPALVFGHIALSRMKRDPSLGGQGLAIAGLIITYFMVLLFVVFMVLILVTGKSFDQLRYG